LPFFASVQRRCTGENQHVIAAAHFIIIFFHERRLCLRWLIILLFFSQGTPLHCAAVYGSLEICRLLIQWNADLQAKANG
jgi:hypothetical protein